MKKWKKLSLIFSSILLSSSLLFVAACTNNSNDNNKKPITEKFNAKEKEAILKHNIDNQVKEWMETYYKVGSNDINDRFYTKMIIDLILVYFINWVVDFNKEATGNLSRVSIEKWSNSDKTRFENKMKNIYQRFGYEKELKKIFEYQNFINQDHFKTSRRTDEITKQIVDEIDKLTDAINKETLRDILYLSFSLLAAYDPNGI